MKDAKKLRRIRELKKKIGVLRKVYGKGCKIEKELKVRLEYQARELNDLDRELYQLLNSI